MVTSVDPDSDASDRGLQRGDLIMSVNNQPVTTPGQVLAVVDQARRGGRTGVVLLVRRGRGPEQFIGVEIGGN
jgi:serine protease Do